MKPVQLLVAVVAVLSLGCPGPTTHDTIRWGSVQQWPTALSANPRAKGYDPDPRLKEEVTDCRAVGDPRLWDFYLRFRPPHALYFFKLLRSPSSVTIVIVRVNEAVSKYEASPVALPGVEQIIGPIPIDDEKQWHLAFAFLRTYSSSPPGGNYCWEDDCYGAFNPRLDNSQEGDFPYPPQNPPGHPPTGGMVINHEPPPPINSGGDPVDSMIRWALAGRDERAIDFARFDQGSGASAPKPVEACPVDPARLAAIKKQAANILSAASAPTTRGSD